MRSNRNELLWVTPSNLTVIAHYSQIHVDLRPSHDGRQSSAAKRQNGNGLSSLRIPEKYRRNPYQFLVLETTPDRSVNTGIKSVPRAVYTLFLQRSNRQLGMVARRINNFPLAYVKQDGKSNITSASFSLQQVDCSTRNHAELSSRLLDALPLLCFLTLVNAAIVCRRNGACSVFSCQTITAVSGIKYM